MASVSTATTSSPTTSTASSASTAITRSTRSFGVLIDCEQGEHRNCKLELELDGYEGEHGHSDDVFDGDKHVDRHRLVNLDGDFDFRLGFYGHRHSHIELKFHRINGFLNEQDDERHVGDDYHLISNDSEHGAILFKRHVHDGVHRHLFEHTDHNVDLDVYPYTLKYFNGVVKF